MDAYTVICGGLGRVLGLGLSADTHRHWGSVGHDKKWKENLINIVLGALELIPVVSLIAYAGEKLTGKINIRSSNENKMIIFSEIIIQNSQNISSVASIAIPECAQLEDMIEALAEKLLNQNVPNSQQKLYEFEGTFRTAGNRATVVALQNRLYSGNLSINDLKELPIYEKVEGCGNYGLQAEDLCDLIKKLLMDYLGRGGGGEIQKLRGNLKDLLCAVIASKTCALTEDTIKVAFPNAAPLVP